MRGDKLLSDTIPATLLTLLVMFLWGSLFPMIKLGYRTFGVNASYVPNVLLYAGVRFVICGLALSGVSCFRSKRLCLLQPSEILSVVAIMIFSYLVHYTLLYIAMGNLSSSKTALIKQIGPLLLICFAFLFRQEDRFSWLKLLAGLLGFVSILVINLDGLSLTFNIYDLLIITASFASAAGMVFSKNAYDRHDPLIITGYAQLTGGVVFLAVGFLLGGRFTRFGWDAVLVMGYTCFASSTGYALWNALLKYNDISHLNTIRFAEALFSALCSWMLLGEDIFRLPYLISFLLVCAGILLTAGRYRRTEKT